MNELEFRKTFLKEFALALIKSKRILKLMQKTPSKIPTQPIIIQQPPQIILPAPPQKIKLSKELPSASPKVKEKVISSPLPPMKAEDKIKKLLQDSLVSAVECPGAEKNLIISKAGATEPTKYVLSAGEISQFLKGLAEKTNIPLEKGMFKAETPEFTLTAIVSDFIGTRFVITKKL